MLKNDLNNRLDKGHGHYEPTCLGINLAKKLATNTTLPLTYFLRDPLRLTWLSITFGKF